MATDRVFHEHICKKICILRELLDVRESALKSIQSDLRKSVDYDKLDNGEVIYHSSEYHFLTRPNRENPSKKFWRLKYSKNGSLVKDVLLDADLRAGPNDIRLSIALGNYDPK